MEKAVAKIQEIEVTRAGAGRRVPAHVARRRKVVRASEQPAAGRSRTNSAASQRQRRRPWLLKASLEAPSSDASAVGEENESSGTGRSREFVRGCVSRALEDLQGQLGSLMVLSLFVWMAMGNADEANAASLQQQQDAIASGLGHPQEIFQVGADDSFWTNVVRYVQYFISLTVGLLYVNLKPLFSMMRKPGTAIFAILFLFGAFTFVKLTVSSMLGLDDPAVME